MSKDPLTGLPDRAQFSHDFEASLDEQNEQDTVTALILIQVRSLRAVNRELGYPMGDSLLQSVVERLQSCLRPTDSASRISGAEFALILPALRSHAQPRMAVAKIQRAFAEPLRIRGHSLKVHLRFGISISPDDASRPGDVLRCADEALTHAQATASDYALYSECTENREPPLLAVGQGLEAVLRDGDIVTHYQPIVDLDSGDTVSFEMMPHWDSPTHGILRRHQLLSVAERYDLIVPYTMTLLNAALRECQEWQGVFPGASVAVDVSPAVLMEPDFPLLVSNAIELWGMTYSQLVLEVTENAVMSEEMGNQRTLVALHEQGIRVAIDNFGTGYSSLAHLRDLPVDQLKVDHSFVRNMIDRPADKRIVQAVIDLAHNFERTVVADGVLDEETLDTLTLMGCEFGQGECVGSPAAADALLDEQKTGYW